MSKASRQRGSDLRALVSTGVVRLGGLGANALQAFILPMLLGPTAFGLFSSLFTVLLVASGIIRVPLEVLVQRGRDGRGEGALRLVYGPREFGLAVLFALLLGTLTYVGLYLAQGRSGSASFAIGLGAATVIAGLSGLRRGEHLVLERTARVEQLDAIVRPALFLGLVGAAWLFGRAEQWWPTLLIASFLLVLAWPNLVAAQRVRRAATGSEAAVAPWRNLTLSNGLSIGVKHADVLIIGAYLSLETVGRYFIIARLADLIAFGYSFAAARFVHRFATAWREGRHGEARAIIGRAMAYGAAISCLMAAGAAFLSPFVLPLIDPLLADYWLALVLLLAAAIINSTLGLCGAFMTALDPRHMLKIKIACNPLAVVAMLVAVPRFGVMGAATVTLGFALSLQLLSAFMFRRLTREEGCGS
ncbi:lipopolysaccharide biosynthesis protein [Sphingomicrobium arenosum]|uniref:lipopolysaccharide biosynthesis protein n=1 Tax=Sphingomicrobium arenosum TaxID=2233861 RepID=UPI00223FF66F|nr:hypothetical protein [Sphingomicrobium arenosum]